MANWITNSEELVNMITKEVTAASNDIRLRGYFCSSCMNVRADERCEASYEKAKQQAKKMQEHISHVTQFIETVNEILTEADRKAAAQNAQ